MKIAFTGGGTGGHFYPIIAVSEAIKDLVREKHLIEPQLHYFAPEPYDAKVLFENGITFHHIPAGKLRRYASSKNFSDFFATAFGTITALFALFRVYPDVVVSKGGFGSVPTVLAARFLRIPIVIHESDSKPGRANLLAAKFATKIAISFESSEKYFPEKARSRIALTGIPIRKALKRVESEGAKQYLNLDASLPTILILGGSSGSKRINEAILSALPNLIVFANVIHQTGTASFKEVSSLASVILHENSNKDRYHPFDFLAEVALERAAGAATIVISRAGATTITEISLWEKPAILIPIPEEISHDQKTNAYTYAHTGAAIVIEEANLTPHVLASEAKRIALDENTLAEMKKAAKGFANPEAATTLASEVLAIALSHET